MSKYSNWISLGALLLLAISCFMPWTYHADVDKTFTGFFSEKNIYGKPGRFLLVLGTVSTLLSFVPALWAKRIALLVCGLNVAYAIKNLLLFGSCYQGYCPEKKAGLFLMVIAASLLLLASLFPKGKLKKETSPAEGPQGAPDGIEE
jgi:hypothetical protein